jgi:hypothetical protein
LRARSARSLAVGSRQNSSESYVERGKLFGVQKTKIPKYVHVTWKHFSNQTILESLNILKLNLEFCADNL